MLYTIIYLLVGAAVAMAMAFIPMPESQDTNQFQPGSKKQMVDAYCFIGLAWPVSVVAFVYGSVAHLLVRSSDNNKNS
jgi:hypothetical protein